MSERVDIVSWLRDLRHSPAVREIGDVGRGLHLAEAEIARLRDEVERLEADRATAVVQTESDYQQEIDTLRAEVKRLRDVVRQLTTSLLSRPVGSEQERLPPHPTLTDAEREAIRLAMNWVLDTGNSHVMPAAATLRALLARHGGGA